MSIAIQTLLTKTHTLLDAFRRHKEIDHISLDWLGGGIRIDMETGETEELNPLPIFLDFLLVGIGMKENYWHSVGMRTLFLRVPASYANLERGAIEAQYHYVSPYASAQIRRGEYSIFVSECIAKVAGWILASLKAPERIVQRSRAIHEELVSVAWAPKRVEAWLDAGVELESL